MSDTEQGLQVREITWIRNHTDRERLVRWDGLLGSLTFRIVQHDPAQAFWVTWNQTGVLHASDSLQDARSYAKSLVRQHIREILV